MRRHAALAFLGLALQWTPAAAREAVLDPVDHALRRAALELGAGRPAAAAEVLSRLELDPRADTRAALAVLLRCEAQLLTGDARAAAAAAADLAVLSAAGDDFVRAQAAAHQMMLSAESSASSATPTSALAAVDSVSTAALAAWEKDHDGLDREAASLAYVAAAWLYTQRGDVAAAQRALESADRGPGALAARLQQGEALLAGSDASAARKQFEALAKASRGDSWMAAWARLGAARAQAQAGDSAKACDVLAEITAPEPLASYARLLRGQWSYARGDRDAARAALRDLNLDAWNPILATEAELLSLQVALDGGDFAAAESLGVGVGARLETRAASEIETGALCRDLVLDVRAWHAAATRGTLAALAKKDVLRRVPDPAQLATPPAVVLLDPNAPGDALPGRVRLVRLYAHEPEAAEVATERSAWRVVAALQARLSRAEAARDAARRRLDERLLLLSRGRAGLDSGRADLDVLAAEAARLAAGLAAHEAAIADLERAWKHLVRARLAGLERALVELQRGSVRITARYPEDRSVRPHEPVASARATTIGQEIWMAAADSLHAEVTGQFEARIAGIFQQHELATDKEKLARLLAEIAALRQRCEALAAALAIADAAERAALAGAEATLAQAAVERDAALETASAASATAREVRMERALSRAIAYQEAAGWGTASAAFHAALASPPEDPDRLARLQHASATLDAFLRRHPASPRADEALYRAGEMALQRASLQYNQDLADYLARGGRAEAAPVPVESYAEALDAYKRLLHDYPQSGRAHDAEHQVGFLLAEMGSVEASCEHLQRFLAQADSLDWRAGRAALRLGDNRLLLGDTPGALVAFRSAAHAPDPETRDLGLFKAGWCAYDLDQHAEARDALYTLLRRAGPDSTQAGPRAAELAPEALELLALAFTADHDARRTAQQLDQWGRQDWDFALLRRMGQIYASRAMFDEAIDTDELLLERHPLHPELPAVGEDLLHWIAVRHGAGATHTRAARLAPLFAPGSDWAKAAADPERRAPEALRPRWQSRLVEEDAVAARADSMSLALAAPEAAAARMAERLRAAAVFEHKAAQADTAHAAAGFARAAKLYEATLDLFPGADGEPTTDLYLGEARYALGDHERAADAYAAAAAHPKADTALVHTASGAELAALDAAAVARPTDVLDRYEKSTREFAAHYPHDGRGVEASARIASLSYKAERWDQADRNYRRVAELTPDAKRAAGARKMVGDIAWKREQYEAAAARYDSALAVARAAGDDSLATALARLVPASLYRAAEVREAKGDRKQAAAGFETLVRGHANFEFADRSLYRAAGLRAAAGDTASAANDYAWLLRSYPKSPLQADALLESGRCREALGEKEVAARAFESFADRYPQHAQARPARLRAGLLFAGSGHAAAADSQYAVVLEEIHPKATAPRDPALAADLWMRRARLARAPAAALPHYRRALECGEAGSKTDRAEALFKLTEAELPAYQAVTLRQPITESLKRKQKAVETLVNGYRNSAEQQVEPWHAAACLRLGETLADFGSALRHSEPPPELQGEDLFAYQETLNKQAEALDDRAVEAWSRGLAAAHQAKHADGWTKATEAKLYPMLATRVPTRPAPLFVLVQP